MSGPRIGDRVYVFGFDGVVMDTGGDASVLVRHDGADDDLWVKPEHLEITAPAIPPPPEPDVGQFFRADGSLYWRCNDSDLGYVVFISAIGIAWREFSQIRGDIELLTLTPGGEA